MKFLGSSLALACLWALLTPLAVQADTASERDARRSGYMVGFVCNMYIHGQVGHMKWLKNGNGEWVIPQHSDSFEWSVENDRYCLRFNGGDEHCVEFPKTTLVNEAVEFEKWMKQDCLFN